MPLMPLMPASPQLISLRPLRRFAGAALAGALVLAPWQAHAEPPQQLPITARWCLQAGPCMALEVASTPRQQAMGLQLRAPLPPLRGMWFPYSPPSEAKFWMHRTPAPLDMLFVSQGRVIAIVADAQPCMRLPCRSYGPDQPVDGVLELAAGEAARLGLKVGSPARIEDLKPTPGVTILQPRH
jgi:uncharacterized membrane protein (UPF0127 family)